MHKYCSFIRTNKITDDEPKIMAFLSTSDSFVYCWFWPDQSLFPIFIPAHNFALSHAPPMCKCTHIQQATNKTAAFNTMQAKTYAIASSHLPLEMNICKNNNVQPMRNVAVVASPGLGGIITASEVLSQCGGDSVCIMPSGITLWMVSVIGVNVRGGLE